MPASKWINPLNTAMGSLPLEQVLLATLTAIGLVELITLLLWWPRIAIPLVLGCVLIEPLLPTSGELLFGGVSIYPSDIVVAAMAGAVLIGLIGGRLKSRRLGPWWVLFTLLAVAAIRGFAAFDPQEVGNAGRELTGFVVAVLFFALAVPRHSMFRTFQRWWYVAASVLSIYAAGAWLQHGVGGFGAGPTVDRALDGWQAILIAQASIIGLLTADFRSRPFAGRLVIALGFTVVLLSQQRTAWAATLAMIVFAAAGNARIQSSVTRRQARMIVFAGAAGVVLLLAVGPSGLSQSLTSAASDPTSANSTASWRIEGWSELVSGRSAVPIQDLLIGDPLGRASFDRVIDNHKVTVSAHSMYVTALVSLGVAGLILLVAGYAAILAGLRRVGRATPSEPWIATMSALLVGQLVYSVGYQVDLEQGIIVGLAILALRLAHKSTSADQVCR